MADGVAFNHLGHCVTDLARSQRFYKELLGFEFERELQPPDDPSSTLLRLPKPVGMTAPGLTHISVSVDDVEAVCARVAEYGGEVLADTNIGFGIFIRDPDGQLIELLPMTYREQLDAGDA